MKTEVKVGIFVAVGLVFLFLLSTQVNKFAVLGKRGYEIGAYLDDVSGLEKNAKLKINGVDAGYVKEILLEGARVKVSLFVFENIKIPGDSTIVLAQESMLGGKFVNIIPGQSDQYLLAGQILKKQKKVATFDETSDSIDKAAQEFKVFIQELRDVLNPESRENLKKSFANLETITEDIKDIISQNRSDINQAISNMKVMASDLSDAAKRFGTMSDKISTFADSLNAIKDDINTKVPEALNKFTAIEDNITDILGENRESLKSAIKSVDSFFANGDKTLAKIDTYLSSMTKSQLHVGFRSEYLMDDGYAKSYASLYYLPDPTKYYMLDIVSGDDYSRLDSSGKPIAPTVHDESKTLVSAQYGRRFDDLLLRVGLIESTGGAGVDYFMYNDRFKASLDAYDFNAVNDVRGDSAHVKLSMRYRFLHHIDAVAGVDNILNDKSRNIFFGLGIGFVDDDLKYLLGSSGGAAGSFIK